MAGPFWCERYLAWAGGQGSAGAWCFPLFCRLRISSVPAPNPVSCPHFTIGALRMKLPQLIWD